MATLSPMKVLLLDEHTAALGPKTAKFVLDLTSRVVTDFRLTTIMVTTRCATRSILATEP